MTAAFTTPLRVGAVLLCIYAGFLLHFALTTEPAVYLGLISETGPFERFGLWLWVLLGLLLLTGARRHPWMLRSAALAFLLAAREADFHKKFTYRSVTALNFYLKSQSGVMPRLVGGALLLLAIGLIVWHARALLRFYRERGGLALPLGQLLLLPLVLVAVSEAIDGIAANMAEGYSLSHHDLVFRSILAIEEGFEMMAPLLFIATLLLYREWRRTGLVAADGTPAHGGGSRLSS